MSSITYIHDYICNISYVSYILDIMKKALLDFQFYMSNCRLFNVIYVKL